MLVQLVVPLLLYNLRGLLESQWLLRRPLLPPQLVLLMLQVAKQKENAKMENMMITATSQHVNVSISIFRDGKLNSHCAKWYQIICNMYNFYYSV